MGSGGWWRVGMKLLLREGAACARASRTPISGVPLRAVEARLIRTALPTASQPEIATGARAKCWVAYLVSATISIASGRRAAGAGAPPPHVGHG